MLQETGALRNLSPRLLVLAAALLVAAGLSGCAGTTNGSVAQSEFEQDNDPLEPVNRAVFSFNLQVDKMLLRPAAVVYRETLPEPMQNGVNNFLTNLRSPVVFANDLLQGSPDRAGTTASRFLVNSTIGVLGVWDAASHIGIEGHSADFGQTLGIWGVDSGPYLVLPFLGPSNPRDTAGLVTEWYLDPFNMWARNDDVEYLIFTRSLVTGIDFRARNLETLDQLERTALDYYVAVRSIYRQRRANAIQQQDEAPDQPIPGISQAEPEGVIRAAARP